MIATVAASAALLTGCKSADQQWYGQVTLTSPRLCVGRHAALGDCFVGGPRSQVNALHVGQCLHVQFQAGKDNGPDRLLSVDVVAGANHRTDCPTAP
jgi:hypothetical protein